VAVAEVVEADDGQARAGDEAVEGFGEQVGVDRGSFGAGEHEPVVVVLFAEGEAFLELASPPRSEDGDGSGVEVDRPTAGAGLDVGDLEGVGDGDDRLVYLEAAGVEVDVFPAQAEDLASAHAGVGREVVGGVEPVLVDAVEKLRSCSASQTRMGGLAVELSFGGSARAATLRTTLPLRSASESALCSISWIEWIVLGAKPRRPPPPSASFAYRPSRSSAVRRWRAMRPIAGIT